MVTRTKTPHDLIKRIREALVELRLGEMARQLDAELEEGPRADDSRLNMLWRLIEPQLIARRESTVRYRLRVARFPASKSLDDFDFAFQPDLPRDRVLELATLDFVRRGQNLLVAGMSGTGKSHLCIALGHLACAAGIATRYTTSADMLATLQASLATSNLPEVLKAYVGPQLLIIDEVGLDRPERDGTPDAQLFYRVIRPRHEAARSTVITSNIDWEKWGAYLGDDVASVAILDRLIEHGHLLTIDGPSYRAKEHSKLNASSTAPRSTTPAKRPAPRRTSTTPPVKRGTKARRKPLR